MNPPCSGQTTPRGGAAAQFCLVGAPDRQLANARCTPKAVRSWPPASAGPAGMGVGTTFEPANAFLLSEAARCKIALAGRPAILPARPRGARRCSHKLDRADLFVEGFRGDRRMDWVLGWQVGAYFGGALLAGCGRPAWHLSSPHAERRLAL